MHYVHNLRKSYAQATWRKQLQLIGAFSLALVLIWMVAALYLDVTAHAAAMGREIQAMQVRNRSYSLDNVVPEQDELSIEELRQINRDLEAKLAELTSNDAMAERAKKLGFTVINNEQIMYLQVNGYHGRQAAQVAQQPGIRENQQQITAPVPQSMLEWLQERYSQTVELVQGLQP